MPAEATPRLRVGQPPTDREHSQYGHTDSSKRRDSGRGRGGRGVDPGGNDDPGNTVDPGNPGNPGSPGIAAPPDATPHGSLRESRLYSPTMVGRDLGYILPGFPIAIISFSLLLTLATASISTLIIWVGVPLLADHHGARDDLRGALARAPALVGRHAPPLRRTSRNSGPGALGMLRALRDPRRWLDLTFEMLVAFPLRIFTFVVTVTWTSLALGGITWAFWGYFLPREGNTFPANFLIAVSEGAIPVDVAHSFWVEAIFYTLVGIVALALLPPIVRGLAVLDATVARAALCADTSGSFSSPPHSRSGPGGHPPPRAAPSDGGSARPRAGRRSSPGTPP